MKHVKCLLPFHLFSAFPFRTDFPVTLNTTSPPQTSSPNRAGLASTLTLCMCVCRSEVPSAVCVCVCALCGRVLQQGNTCQQSASHRQVQVQWTVAIWGRVSLLEDWTRQTQSASSISPHFIVHLCPDRHTLFNLTKFFFKNTTCYKLSYQFNGTPCWNECNSSNRDRSMLRLECFKNLKNWRYAESGYPNISSQVLVHRQYVGYARTVSQGSRNTSLRDIFRQIILIMPYICHRRKETKKPWNCVQASWPGKHFYKAVDRRTFERKLATCRQTRCGKESAFLWW